ncbi:MAG: HlyD family efflux transporter periplasmic adaptor subunit [Acutalibacteraceae bacterium]
MNGKTNNKIKKIIIIVLIVSFFSSYIVYQIISKSNAEIKTEYALKETVYKTIDTTCFVIRDEEFIHSSQTGTTVSFVTNGERVASGDTVSVVFNNPDDASNYLQIQEVKKDIAHYEDLSRQANFQTLNIDTLTRKINDELTDYLEAVDVGDYSDAISNASTVRDSITGKQIATGSSMDFTEKINSLYNTLADLESRNASYSEIKTNSAGYFISGADGYESALKYQDIDSITAEDVAKAIKSKPQSVPDDIVGRTVSSFKWYIACVITDDESIAVESDKKLYVNFPSAGIEKLPVSLYKMGEKGDKTLVIFSCDEMNEDLSNFRIEDIEIITDEYTGLKISNSAIRTVDGEQGVYIVRGNLMGFRKVHIVYSNSQYSLVDNPDNASGYIKLYDKVVTEGVDLYDNKLV